MTAVITPNETTDALNVVELTQSIHSHCSDSSDSETVASDEECSECCTSCCAASIENHREERIGNYIIGEKLHYSEYGKIKLGRHTDSEQKFIIEIAKKNDNTISSDVKQLIDIHRTLKHPNLIKLIDVVNTTRRTGIVLEYPLGGDLFEYLLEKNPLNEEDAAKLFAQLVSGVKYMHSKGVVHRDIKLENTYFSDEKKTNLIIANFSFASNENFEFLTTNCGSPIYAAPEIIFKEPNGYYHGPTADIWSLGVVLFCFLCGYLPFDDDEENPGSENINLLYRYIRTSSLTIRPGLSDQAKDLLLAMLKSNPSLRCNMDYITHHPWLHLYHDQLNNIDPLTFEEQANITIEKLKPVEDTMNQNQEQHNHHNHHQLDDQQKEQKDDDEQKDTHSRHVLPDNHAEQSLNHEESKQDENVLKTETDVKKSSNEVSKQDENVLKTETDIEKSSNDVSNQVENVVKTETNIEKSKGKDKAKDKVDLDEKSKENDHEKLPSLHSSTTTSSSASTSNTPISPSTTNNNITELDNAFTIIKEKEIHPLPLEQNNNNNNNNDDDKYHNTLLNKSVINEIKIEDIPLPPIPNEDEPIGNGSTITTTSTRQRSIRRMSHISSPKKENSNNGHHKNNNNKNDQVNTTTAAATVEENDNDNSLLHKNENRTTVIDKDETKNKNTIQKHEIASSPLLGRPQGLSIDTTPSAEDNKNTKSRDSRRRTISGMLIPKSLQHGRNLSTDLLSSRKTPKDQPVQRNASTSKTLDHPTKNNPHSVSRKKTFRDSFKSIFGRPPSGKSRILQSSTSSSSVSLSYDIAPKPSLDQQQQQQEEEGSSEPISSSSTTPLETPIRVLTTSSTRECLTKIPPHLLIFSLMRILSALGIKNQMKSTYQIVCLRPSDHHHQDITKHSNPSLYNVAPIYGPDSIDKGHHIDFTIEICKSQIQDVYALDFHKSKGDTTAFQFVKAKILALADLQSSTL